MDGSLREPLPLTLTTGGVRFRLITAPGAAVFVPPHDVFHRSRRFRRFRLFPYPYLLINYYLPQLAVFCATRRWAPSEGTAQIRLPLTGSSVSRGARLSLVRGTYILCTDRALASSFGVRRPSVLYTVEQRPDRDY